MIRDRRLLAAGSARSRATPAPTPAPAPSPLHTIREVAATLGVCQRTVRRFIARGALASHQVGRSVRVSVADLRTYLAIARQQKS